MKHRLIIALIVAAAAWGYLAVDRWLGSLTDSNATVRDFVMTPVFTVGVILGGLVAAMIAFGWLVFTLFPRAAGRTASGEAE